MAPTAVAVVPFRWVTIIVSGLGPATAVSGTATPTSNSSVSRAPSATEPDFGNPGQLRVLVSVHGIVNALLLSFVSCQRVVTLESPAAALSAEMNTTAGVDGGGDGCGGCGGWFGPESGGASARAIGASGLFPPEDPVPLFEQPTATTVIDVSIPSASITRILIDASSKPSERGRNRGRERASGAPKG